MGSIKHIFLDRDGTINVDRGFVHRVEDFELLPGALEGLQRLAGQQLFVITNQSGIARGMYTAEQVEIFHDHMERVLEEHGVEFAGIYFSPDAPGTSATRKPSPAFMHEAAKAFGFSVQDAWVVGDRASDIEMAKRVSASSVLVLTGRGRSFLSDARSLGVDYIAADLDWAARFIQSEARHKRCSAQQIASRLAGARSAGARIVTFNGAFDILHPGHRAFIEQAGQQGDVLVAGLNSDASVKQLKGEARPFNHQQARARALEAFPEIDHLVVFDEADPLAFLERVRPNVHVNGAEYGRDCVERGFLDTIGAELVLIDRIGDHATSAVVEA